MVLNFLTNTPPLPNDHSETTGKRKSLPPCSTDSTISLLANDTLETRDKPSASNRAWKFTTSLPAKLWEFLAACYRAVKEFFFGKKDQLPAPPPSQRGEIIVDTFDLKGVAAKEKAERARTVTILIQGIESELSYLKKLAHKTSAAAQPRIQYLEKQLKLCKEQKGVWASTNAPRWLFSIFGREKAKEKRLPVLGNLRAQTVEIDDKIASHINRSAAVTDFAYGKTSLATLEELLINVKKSVKTTATDNIIKKQSAEVSKAYGKDRLMTGNQIDVEKLSKLIEERRNVLRQQVLQDLYVHLRKRPAQDMNIFYGRTSLVDTTKNAKDFNGFVLDEKNQALDMYAIYNQLDGAEIVFDLKDSEGPYFDLENRIHMPKLLAKGVSKAKMETLFMNISVQGNKNNEGVQELINKTALDKLDKKMSKLTPEKQQLAQDLKLSLDDKNTKGFRAADKSIELMTSLGYTSVNCYGGKDRTGFAMATNTHRILAGNLKARGQHDDEIDLKIREKLVGENGIAQRIAQDNTKIAALKLIETDLPLFKDLLTKQAGNFFKAAAGFFMGKLLEKEGGEGALYEPSDAKGYVDVDA